MSTVIRPSGPLPPRVYWTRRVLALAVLVVLLSVLWWLVSGIGDASEPSGGQGGPTGVTAVPTPTTTMTTAPTDGWLKLETAPTETTEDTKGQPKPKKSVDYGGEDIPPSGEPTSEETTSPSKTAAPSSSAPVPATICAATDLDLHIDVSDAVVGRPMTAEFSFSSLTAVACTLDVTPETLVARVTSGDDVTWSSNDCPDALLARKIVVPAQGSGSYTFSWDGRRSTDECAGKGSVPDPGGYWVEAALVGGQAHKSYFDLTR